MLVKEFEISDVVEVLGQKQEKEKKMLLKYWVKNEKDDRKCWVKNGWKEKKRSNKRGKHTC